VRKPDPDARKIPYDKAKADALAFLIWRHATEANWDLTLADLARLVGEKRERVQAICIHRGWTYKLRMASPKRDYGSGGLGTYFAGVAEANKVRRRLSDEEPE
jgi:hypothetical protein